MPMFLFWIGAYNVVGSVVLFLCLHEAVADVVLRRATGMVASVYTHGKFSRTWMLWAASVNLGLGVVMMFASEWPLEAMRVVTAASLSGYFIVLVAGIAVRRDPKWGVGLYVGLALWVAQIAWGGWALASG